MYFFVCVQSLKPELEGTYVCKAANKLGQIETAFQVPGFIEYMRYMIHPHARLLTSWDRERQP